ncbi:protein IQ-DOMAIN 1-like isoform X1 [Coffea eugenioides]|uniref:protein IQ-DOMAIN 1 isoform X1 n=1 Tax=Coffea eugenioides TaxID=49369 RepID=UPI000F5C4D59|nr:protein IQ-DOMAIN 1-like [Coffea arabica]XP_027162187.1 protein IQ-DOMAIN 1 isoform X1 [Coffea eugenioides]XP_027182811.1 protein IQ-DOMAIN 1-like isoform X1 [Coffea eugenioides]
MGSGDWLKNIISKKKVKDKRSKKLKEPASKKSKEQEGEYQAIKETSRLANDISIKNERVPCIPTEDVAAIRIQTAFRGFMARKKFRYSKGVLRLQALLQGHSVKKQASSTLSYLHSWSKMQAHIRARRICMVTEGRLRQKKLENQLKLEAKLHDLEVEWNGGSETMEEVMARIHQREEAAGKRERAMAYAFSHQWRANTNPNFGWGSTELGKTNWGWSWMDRWIAARPWECRVAVQSSPKKSNGKKTGKTGKNINTPTTKTPVTVKTISPNGKGAVKARRLSFEAADKIVTPKGTSKAEEAGITS